MFHRLARDQNSPLGPCSSTRRHFRARTFRAFHRADKQRNIANQFHTDDDSALAVLTYAVQNLGVEHGQFDRDRLNAIDC